jgi:integration host factor subunit beta
MRRALFDFVLPARGRIRYTSGRLWSGARRVDRGTTQGPAGQQAPTDPSTVLRRGLASKTRRVQRAYPKDPTLMTKSQLIELVANSKPDLSRKVVEQAVNAVFDELVEAMKRGERIEIRGFGNFTVRQYRSYTGRNPKTGASVDVAPKSMPFFKVGKDLRDRINADG